MIKNLIPSTFVSNLKLAIAMLVLVVVVFSIYVWSEKKVDQAKSFRDQSVLLMDTLRQSSDNLTRMVRTYIATGNSDFKQYYQDIIDIRNGNKSRPKNYNLVYWDLVITGEVLPSNHTTDSVSLLELMRQASFPEQELQKLSGSKANSDKLTAIEFNAIALLESSIAGDKSKAQSILYDDNYHLAKSAILNPINEVTFMMNKRTNTAISNAKTFATTLRAVLIGFVLGFIFVLLRLYSIMKAQLGSDLSSVHNAISSIGNTDFTSLISVQAGKENSILGSLAKTQSNLIQLTQEREQAEGVLRDKEERLALATIHNGIGVWDWNLQTLEMIWDDSMFSLYHMQRADFSGAVDAWEKSLHPDDSARSKLEVQDAISGKKAFDTTFRVVWSNGEIHHIKAVAQVFRDENGKALRMLGTNIDVTERKQAENDLRIAAIAFESQEGMIVTDADSIIIQVNKAFTTITGYSAEEVIGKNPSMLSSGQHDALFYIAMWKDINATNYWEGQIWNKRKDGDVYPEKLTITAVKDSNGNISNYVATLTDITLSTEAEQEIEELAYYDPLTHLPNRRLMIDRIKHAMAASTRSSNEGALLFLDLDHFKDINDTLGHDIGDLLLQQVAERLTSCLRENDTVSRFGGDEFVVLLEGLSSKPMEAAAQAEDIANKILSSINLPYQLINHHYNSSASIGISLFDDHKYGVDELLKQADIALYQAKDDGRNTLRFFDPQMQAKITARVALEKELKQAIDQQQFELYYQIQLDDSLHPLGAEALIRWNHPERGLTSPIDFIPIAEQNGTILAIGQWVLDTACAQLKVWQHDEATRGLTLSVNVSAKQFHQAGFTSQVIMAVQQHAINPALLKLELTESLLLDDVESTISKMNTLAKIGIQFSLDDFGTGYSSLQYLKRLPLHQLKIDKSFVDDIVSGNNDQAIVRTIIAMAHSLGLSVIAEGVETKEQQQCLLTEGCTHYQGYLFGKPVPIDEFEAILRS